MQRCATSAWYFPWDPPTPLGSNFRLPKKAHLIWLQEPCYQERNDLSDKKQGLCLYVGLSLIIDPWLNCLVVHREVFCRLGSVKLTPLGKMIKIRLGTHRPSCRIKTHVNTTKADTLKISVRAAIQQAPTLTTTSKRQALMWDSPKCRVIKDCEDRWAGSRARVHRALNLFLLLSPLHFNSAFHFHIFSGIFHYTSSASSRNFLDNPPKLISPFLNSIST